MKNLKAIKLTGFILRHSKWIFILFTLVAISNGDTLRIAIFSILTLLFFSASHFAFLARKYLYNFNYFSIDKKIIPESNIISNIVIDGNEYDDVPEPKKIFTFGVISMITGVIILLIILLLIIASIFAAQNANEAAYYLMLSAIVFPFAFSLLYYTYNMLAQFKYYKYYYNSLIGVIDNSFDDNRLINEINKND